MTGIIIPISAKKTIKALLSRNGWIGLINNLIMF
jgi:hypothetical protein